MLILLIARESFGKRLRTDADIHPYIYERVQLIEASLSRSNQSTIITFTLLPYE
jgi:hypothetical protein